jgi:predicted Fe-Mo cluster-binding NifX family protein
MKIAIPTESDGIQVSSHMGSSPNFLVFEVQAGQVVGSEARANSFADPKFHAHGSPREAGMDPHQGIAQLVSDCDAVLGYGHACGAVGALEAAGLKVYMLNAPCSAQQAIDAFVKYLAVPSPS